LGVRTKGFVVILIICCFTRTVMFYTYLQNSLATFKYLAKWAIVL